MVDSPLTWQLEFVIPKPCVLAFRTYLPQQVACAAENIASTMTVNVRPMEEPS